MEFIRSNAAVSERDMHFARGAVSRKKYVRLRVLNQEIKKKLNIQVMFMFSSWVECEKSAGARFRRAALGKSPNIELGAFD